jgi:hypothetical protein
MQDRLPPAHQNLLATHGRTIQRNRSRGRALHHSARQEPITIYAVTDADATVMSSIMRRRSGLMHSSVMGYSDDPSRYRPYISPSRDLAIGYSVIQSGAFVE